MTYRQEIIMGKVREHIKDLRNMLDDLMYNNSGKEQLSDDEFRRAREAYDLICQANDKL